MDLSAGFAVLGFVLTGVGTVLAIQAHRQKRNRRTLAFEVQEFELIHDSISKIPGIDISFNNNRVQRLVAANVRVVNIGSEAVRRHDVANADPLRVTSRASGALLSMQLAQRSNPATAAACTLNPAGGGTITFDFLAPGDHVVISCLHTGALGSTLAVDGTIIDGRLRMFDPAAARMERKLWPVALLCLLIVVVGIAVDVFTPWPAGRQLAIAASTIGLVIGVAGTILIKRQNRTG